MFRRLLLLGLLGIVPMAFGQNVFVAVENGTPRQVKEVRHRRAFIESDGELVAASGGRYGLACATVYRPGSVTFHEDFRVGTRHLEVRGTGSLQGSYNYEMLISGHATADTTLKNCFLVLELTTWKDKGILFAELPDLTAGQAVRIDLAFPLIEHLEEGSYRLHLFSDGIEVLHSRMRKNYLEMQKKKTADLLAGNIQDFPPILAYPTRPVYPEALKKAGVAGSARVRCRIDMNGHVASVELLSATEPAFGEAALAAVPQWKFDPALKGRRFTGAIIEVPVEFHPPKKSGG